MSESLYIKLKKKIDLFKSSLVCFFTCFIFLFPLFPTAVLSIALSLFIISGFFLTKKKINKEAIIIFLFATSWIFILLISLSYSNNIDYGIKLSQRYFNILLIVAVFLFFLKNKVLYNKFIFFTLFIISNIIFVVVIYYKAIIIIEQTCYPQIYYKPILEKILFVLKKPNHIIFSCFESQTKHSLHIHRVYNSMGFLFSILLTLELLFSREVRKKSKNYIYYFLGVLVITFFTFLIFYQFSVVNVVLTLILVPLFLIIKIKIKKRYILSLVLLFIVFALSREKFNNNDILFNVAKNQLQPAANLIIKTFTGDTKGDVDERFEINKANVYLIKNNLIFGVGIGDVQDELNTFYLNHINESKVYGLALEKTLNSHNNYAFLWIAGGLILLIPFLINLLFSLYVSYTNRDWLFLCFIILITINMLTENILSRMTGILFYTLFNSLFLASNKLKLKL